MSVCQCARVCIWEHLYSLLSMDVCAHTHTCSWVRVPLQGQGVSIAQAACLEQSCPAHPGDNRDLLTGMCQPRSPTAISFPSRERPHYSCRSKDQWAGSVLLFNLQHPLGWQLPGWCCPQVVAPRQPARRHQCQAWLQAQALGLLEDTGSWCPPGISRSRQEKGYARRQQESLAPAQAEGTWGVSKLCSTALAVPASWGSHS